MAIVLVLFLLWAIFFSGWVIDRDDTDTAPTNVEQEGDTEIDIEQPADEQEQPAEEEQPAPGSSP
ncbi:MAG: hypothetical protein ACRDI1_10690 [Actinomycetota bacterium]